ncbi:MAG: penicillin-binding protein activator LpoB [Desulfobacteraceae bacterium]|nr:penicillin-binding protein activator LpoB [Desulfobacteraceae bacterium]MBC2719635.1 penicillin-binding protein activator LpoB [Desulfobacteraceae bacterium]
MYRLKLTGILLCVMILMFLTTALAKERVAIMDFDNKSQHGGWQLGQGTSDMLTTELVKTGKFNVMERDRLAAIIKEQNLGASGRIDPSTAARIGKIIGVEYIITGAITEYGQSRAGGGGGGVNIGKKGYHATVDIRMINAATGEIVFADSASHSKSTITVRIFGIGGGESFNEKKATEVMREAIKNLAAKITSAPIKSVGGKDSAGLSGSGALVADVDGNIITLNKGKNAGLKTGQKVTISRKGKIIKDPQTGKILKIKYKKIGAIKLTEVEDSYAEGEIISGSGFNVGDIVR